MRSRVLALSLLAPLLLVPASSSAAPSSEKAGPAHHRPEVGACYDYGVRGLNGLTGPKNEVSCDESHRAITVAAPLIDADFSDREDPVIFEKAGARCYRAAYKAVGGTHEIRALTAYSIGYYVPTKAEIDKGARWVRCDLLLFGGERLMPLPDPYLPATPDDSVALCLVDQYEAGTVCARDHKYRATGVVTIKGDDYPTDARFDRIGQRRCDTRTTTDDYIWRWPNEQAWDAGKHLLTCYSRTRS